MSDDQHRFSLNRQLGLIAYLLLREKEPAIGMRVVFEGETPDGKFGFVSSHSLKDWELDYSRSSECRHDMLLCHVRDRIQERRNNRKRDG